MALPNIFTTPVVDGVIDRINKLTPLTTPQWGKMTVDQMLAHCCVAYELEYESDKHPKPGILTKLMLKMLVKNKVVSETPYKHNSATAPAFIITGERDFGAEKTRLINYIKYTQQLGENTFAGKASYSFGPLTITEWNNLFYKHLNHHLTQFGV